MNERIDKLMYHAGLTAQGCWDEMDEYDRKAIEKFAESIIRECVGVCLDRHYTWRWDNELDSDSGPRDCARSIQEHFGLEELFGVEE